MAKVLSVKQPYALYICTGVKTVENRTWKTDYRGRLVIHASGDPFLLPYIDALPECYQKEWNKWLDENPDVKFTDPDNLSPALKKYKELTLSAIKHYGLDIEEDMPESELIKEIKERAAKTGAYFRAKAVIGECELVDIIQNSANPFAEKNCYHWILEKPILYKKPVLNVFGKLRLWNFDLPDIV